MPDPDLGKESRADYEKNNPDETKNHPEYDKAYLEGEPQPQPGGGMTKAQLDALRKKLAEKASRYLRPSNGYRDGDARKGPKQTPTTGLPFDPTKEEAQGGGIYLKPDQTKGRTDAQICDSVYHWVEDMFWPKGAHPRVSNPAKLNENWGKADEIDKGNLDIGKRLPDSDKSAWFCGEQAKFLAWLLRQLGYKVQYANLVPSKADSKPPNDIVITEQTAAIRVWYGGKWHVYDPFESFTDADGGFDAFVNQKGDCAAPYSDAYVYIWQRGNHTGFTWDAPNPDKAKTEDVLDEYMRQDGWTRHDYVKKRAGATTKSLRSEIRIGLESGGAQCGWFGEPRDSWSGARYRPFGRPVGSSMGSTDVEPAPDECVDFNLHEEATLPVAVTVTNVGGSKSPFAVEIVTCDGMGLKVSASRTRLRGALPAGQSRTFELTFQAKRTAWPPPAPVCDVRARVHEGRVYLHWGEVAGARSYRIYRSDGEIVSKRALAKAKLMREVPVPFFETPRRGKKPVCFTVIAVDSRRRVSGIDPQQGSSVVV